VSPSDDHGGDAAEQPPESLVEAVCARLLRPPYLERLIEAVRAQEASAGPLPAASTTEGDGPVPIGPYEIPLDFSQIEWDTATPATREWPPDADTPRAPRKAASGRGTQGPQVSFGRRR
jgi:hypothetical protein